jgi:hypothetical protein
MESIDAQRRKRSQRLDDSVLEAGASELTVERLLGATTIPWGTNAARNGSSSGSPTLAST